MDYLLQFFFQFWWIFQTCLQISSITLIALSWEVLYNLSGTHKLLQHCCPSIFICFFLKCLAPVLWYGSVYGCAISCLYFLSLIELCFFVFYCAHLYISEFLNFWDFSKEKNCLSHSILVPSMHCLLRYIFSSLLALLCNSVFSLA